MSIGTTAQPLTQAVDLLRFTTAGSVDDGKSTLIGRLLYDSKSIFEDTVSAIERTTQKRGGSGIDLSLLTDGLIAEREQGITIDVAYRYFATPKRRFIIADTPGHEQYTRNMVTGASTADLAIILVDAAKGVSPQSRRHALIAKLLGIRHIVVAVNKMDSVNYAQEAFNAIRDEFLAVGAQFKLIDLRIVPISALHGDMIVTRGDRLSWYPGPTLLEILEQVDTQRELLAAAPLRFPVQLVNRPLAAGWSGTRGYMGRIESGRIAVGDVVTVLPSGAQSRVKDIVTFDGSLAQAQAPQSVSILLEDELDISRGDMLVHAAAAPAVVSALDTQLCWMDAEPLLRQRRYLIKHTTRSVKASAAEIIDRHDVQLLDKVAAPDTLRLNDIGRVKFKLQQPLAVDSYADNRLTGSFIVIDEASNHTVAAGVIQ